MENSQESTSNNWEQRFNERYPHEQKRWVFKTDRSNIKSFISQEIEKAREEGRREIVREAISDENTMKAGEDLFEVIAQEERQRFLALIEEEKKGLLYLVVPEGGDDADEANNLRAEGAEEALDSLKQKLIN